MAPPWMLSRSTWRMVSISASVATRSYDAAPIT